ncbi:MAG: NUDIX hydrolase [Flavobacteriales bacterium]|nr:NUDIX hydrolase [Flavobacteriales bacterium]|tara:strand:- start:852 stop:1547 length:696 start_codon:yes stop_codon:yes gene_type:complete
MSKINVSVDCVIFGFDDKEKQLKVLLIQKKINPYDKKNNEKQIALPGDLIRLEEDIDDSAKRVLYSLTKLNNVYLRQFKAFGDPKRVESSKDQEWLKNFRKEPNERVITIGYISLVRMEDYNPSPSYFADEVRWISIDDVPLLAFDHNDIVESGLFFLRKELNSELTSELLPRKFTLSQLQELHEIVLEQKFDKRNFRKRAFSKGKIKETSEKQKGVSHKPARLYSFRNLN